MVVKGNVSGQTWEVEVHASGGNSEGDEVEANRLNVQSFEL
jgi:hypothetical protein